MSCCSRLAICRHSAIPSLRTIGSADVMAMSSAGVLIRATPGLTITGPGSSCLDICTRLGRLAMPDALPPDQPSAARRRWMAVLARAGVEELAESLEAGDGIPPYRILRGPEAGLVMVRGRTG